MKKGVINKHKRDNLVIIEWILSLYGAYIGIWLGLFIDAMNRNKYICFKKFTITPFNKIASTGLIVLFPILFSIFSIFMVKWLFIIKDIYPDIRLKDYYKKIKNSGGISLYIAILIGIFLISYLYGLSFSLCFSGIFAISSWLVIILILIRDDRRSWGK